MEALSKDGWLQRIAMSVRLIIDNDEVRLAACHDLSGINYVNERKEILSVSEPNLSLLAR